MILKQGMTGKAVNELQLALSNNGVPCTVDGDFGPKTETAVKLFQEKAILTIDGIAGPKTLAALGISPLPEAPKPAPIGSHFDAAFAYTIGNEGDYSNDPHDLGGPTRWGIIQSEYSRYIGHKASIEEMKHLPIEHAKDIYWRQYWNALHIDKVDSKNVSIALFDRSVLNGLMGCSRLVRQTLGKVETGLANFDDRITEINQSNPITFVMNLADKCEAFHRARVAAHPDQHVFLLGWLNRVARMQKELGDGSVRPVHA